MGSAAIIDLERTLDDLVAQDHTALADPLLLADTERLLAAKTKLDAVLARRLQRVDNRDLTVAAHGRQTRPWLIEEKLLDATDAAHRMAVARNLPYHPDLEDALVGARLNHDHARVILACLRRTPPGMRDVVEKELIKAAETVDPSMLATFCRELVSRLGGDEDAEAAAQRRHSRRWARLVDTYDGMVRLDGMLDPVGAATIRAAIAPLLERAGEVDDRSAAQRTADALVALAEHAMADGVLPEQGGEKPQLVVTMSYPDFIAGQEDKLLASAKLNGIRISGATARMLACDAGVIPVVLGSHGEALDLGRKTAVWSAAQRRALRAEHEGCGFGGCQAPANRCQAHHIKFRSRGGRTDVSNGVLLCRFITGSFITATGRSRRTTTAPSPSGEHNWRYRAAVHPRSTPPERPRGRSNGARKTMIIAAHGGWSIHRRRSRSAATRFVTSRPATATASLDAEPTWDADAPQLGLPEHPHWA